MGEMHSDTHTHGHAPSHWRGAMHGYRKTAQSAQSLLLIRWMECVGERVHVAEDHKTTNCDQQGIDHHTNSTLISTSSTHTHTHTYMCPLLFTR